MRASDVVSAILGGLAVTQLLLVLAEERQDQRLYGTSAVRS